MGNQFENIQQPGFQLPITDRARRTARQFAQTQPTLEKADQVQQNTLAVWVTNDYCQMMGIPTDLEQSDSWNPVTRMMANVADLVLPGIGRLECRPVTVAAETCFIPPEVWDLRVGYIVVELDRYLQTAQLLGFTPAVTAEDFALSELNPLEDIFDHLYALRQSSAITSPGNSVDSLSSTAKTAVSLRQWLNHTFATGWQAVETVLNSNAMHPAISFRSADVGEQTEPNPPPANVRCAKLIDLAVQLGSRQVVLVVELQSESTDKMNISLQVHPTGERPYLPPGLELTVLESSNEVFMEARARQADSYIQLQFSGEPDEHFKVRINMTDEAGYIEEFIV